MVATSTSSRTKYEVHAELAGAGLLSPSFDESMAGHPIERRVKPHRARCVGVSRSNRSSSRQQGVLVRCRRRRRTGRLRNATSMRGAAWRFQRSGSPCIGIHQITARERSHDNSSTTDETAARLAAVDDTVLVSESVFSALNLLDLRTIGRPASSLPAAAPVIRSTGAAIPSSAYGGESSGRPTTARRRSALSTPKLWQQVA